MAFSPEPLTGVKSLEDLIAYQERQNRAIQEALAELLPVKPPILHAPPAKPREPMIVFADGTDWNPGDGRGYYAYINGIWVGLGIPPVAPPEEPPPPPPPPPDPGTEAPDWLFSFETSVTENGEFAIQAASASRVSLVNTSRTGTKGVRLFTSGTDTGLFGSGANERCDLRLNNTTSGMVPGAEFWFACSIFLPDDFVTLVQADGSGFYNLLNFHPQSGGNGGANFNLGHKCNGINHQPRWTCQIAGGDTTNREDIDLFGGEYPQKNLWHDFVVNYKVAKDNTGFVKLWTRQGNAASYTKAFERLNRPTIYNADALMYLKVANYHSPRGVPSAVIHDRVCRGPSSQSVTMAPLDP